MFDSDDDDDDPCIHISSGTSAIIFYLDSYSISDFMWNSICGYDMWISKSCIKDFVNFIANKDVLRDIKPFIFKILIQNSAL